MYLPLHTLDQRRQRPFHQRCERNGPSDLNHIARGRMPTAGGPLVLRR